MKFKDIKTLDVYAGDVYEQPVKFTKVVDGVVTPIDLTENYTEFHSQWRSVPDSTRSVTVVIDGSDAANGVLVMKIANTDTPKMIGSGVIDIEAHPGPTTIARFNVETELDVTRE